MKKLSLLTVAILLGVQAITFAQRRPRPFLITASDERVYILVVGAPEGAEGFRVQRKGPGDGDFVLRTPAGIGAIVNPAAARKVLGEDYPWVARALRAEDEFDVVRRLKSDPGASATVSLASLKAARVAGRLYVDEDVDRGRQYRYRVEFLDFETKVLSTSEAEVRTRDRKPPAPTLDKCDAGDSQVKVSWEYAPYAGDPDDITVGFFIYRSGADGKYERINNAPVLRQEDLKYRTDLSVQNDQPYSYYVTAVDFIGRESEPSTILSALPKDMTPPAIPRGIQSVAEEGRILVAWQMGLELDLSHYDIYRSLDMHEGYEKINTLPIPVDQSAYVDSLVHSGPLYHYKVRAIDRVGNESDFSNVTTARPADKTPPPAPDSLAATVIAHYAQLTWAAPATPDLQGYYVYRRRSDQEFMRIVGVPVPKDSLRFLDTGYKLKGLWAGKGYEYGVSAVDNAYNESAMSTVEIIIPDDEPPGPPASSHARSTDEGEVEITWQPTPALDVAKYRIYRGRENLSPTVWLETGMDAFTALDSTAAPGVAHSYEVAAVDEWGNESTHTPATVVIPHDLKAPLAPREVQALADEHGVQVTWDAVRARDLVGYNVYRLEIPTGAAAMLNRRPITTTSYIDPEGKPGDYYRVSSLDASGLENAEGRVVEAEAISKIQEPSSTLKGKK